MLIIVATTHATNVKIVATGVSRRVMIWRWVVRRVYMVSVDIAKFTGAGLLFVGMLSDGLLSVGLKVRGLIRFVND